ncbi:MAG: hypothetical protein K2L87_04790, partial [Clostridiales bacterium]|nr:hypothetical protein [Clostridiales bacterium]
LPNTADLQFRFLSNNGAPYLASDGKIATARGKAWAIISTTYDGESYMEQDEDGEPQPVTPHYGGELLLAENVDINVGDTIAKFNIVPTHNIFDFIKRS